jgi:hypothetical protein
MQAGRIMILSVERHRRALLFIPWEKTPDLGWLSSKIDQREVVPSSELWILMELSNLNIRPIDVEAQRQQRLYTNRLPF